MELYQRDTEQIENMFKGRFTNILNQCSVKHQSIESCYGLGRTT